MQILLFFLNSHLILFTLLISSSSNNSLWFSHLYLSLSNNPFFSTFLFITPSLPLSWSFPFYSSSVTHYDFVVLFFFYTSIFLTLCVFFLFFSRLSFFPCSNSFYRFNKPSLLPLFSSFVHCLCLQFCRFLYEAIRCWIKERNFCHISTA